jgi:PAS domain S-box-containing protein
MRDGKDQGTTHDVDMPGTKTTEGELKVVDDKIKTAEGDMEPAIGKPSAIVGIGASAGGLEALQQLFAAMPSDSGMSFVVIMHLVPDITSMLPEILSRCTSMEVVPVKERMNPQPNTVYVIPPGKDLNISGRRLRVEEQAQPRGVHHPVDRFLRSLAAEMAERSIAVILSGSGTDGAEGAKAVKGVAGIVVVQEPNSALYSGMPRSAIGTGAADLILPVEQIPAKLIEIARRLIVLSSRTRQAVEIDEQLHAIFHIVKAKTGHDFSSYKTNTVLRRIERRMTVNGVSGIGRYISLLQESFQEANALCREFLIGVTSFFRDPEAFETLRNVVIPKLFADRDPDEPVRIWHACCATGEEVYSTAILIREYLSEQKLDAKVQIFATDLDDSAVVQARAGLYHEGIAADVGEERLRTFFTEADTRYQVAKQLREMIVFAHHNLLRDPPFSRLDLLVCRNFLIYLNPDMQKRVISLFHQVLRPGGFLFLGNSETLGGHPDLFNTVDKKWKIFECRNNGRRLDTAFPLSTSLRKLPGTARPFRLDGKEEPGPGEIVEKILMQRYSPSCVVVNEKYEVVYFSTRPSRFLEVPVGEPTRDILKMAREELRPALRAAIHKAITGQEQVVFRGVKVAVDGEEATANVLVEPVCTHSAGRRLAMVVFETATPSAPVSSASACGVKGPAGDELSKDMLIRQLEEQLRMTQEQLHAVIAQLETSNEGLMSANEELISTNEEYQSTNEELQSTNEELETSKEELQALNEELVTVNAELQGKVEELNRINSDMENLLTSSEIATIFLDRQLKIKRFTPAMAVIFDLIPFDIGRSFRLLAGKIEWPGFSRDAETVLEKLTTLEREVTTLEEGRCFIMRVLPYRTTEGKADGIVVTFVDITERKRAEEALRRAKEEWERTFNSVPDLVAILDDKRRILRVNRAMAERLGRQPEECMGLYCNEAVHGTNEPPAHCPHAMTLADGWEHGVEIHEDRLGGDFFVTTTPLLGPEGQMVGTVHVARDITERRKAAEEIARSEQKFRAIFENARDAFFLIAADTTLIDCNRAATELYGCDREKLLKEKPTSFSPAFQPDGRESEKKSYEIFAAAMQGDSQYFEWKHQRPDGTQFDAVISLNRFELEGEPMLLAIVRDISDRIKDEEQIKAQAAQLRALMDNLPFALWAIGSDRRYFMQNTIDREIWGNIIGKRLEEWAPSQEVLDKWLEENRRAFAGEVVKLETECAVKGERRLFYKIITPIVSEQSVLGIMGVNIDITDRKRAEEALRQSEERWLFAIEGSNDGVWDRNIRTGEVFFSRRWKEMLGIAPDEIGNGVDEWSKRVHTEDLPRVKEEIERHFRGETPYYSSEYRIQCKDGSYKWILARGKVISRTEDGRPIRFVGTHTDMTDRKNLEEQLYQSQKMEAVGLLAGGVAHDFNNILTAIIGYSHLVLMKAAGDDPLRDYIGQIRDSAERAAELTQALLAFSRKQVMVSKVVNLNETVIHLQKMLRRLLNENIELRMEILPEKLNVIADNGKIEQVLMNLATNAKDAMPKGGTLCISTSLVTMNGEFPHSHGYGASGNYACVSVSDTGCGMDAETKEKIFEPFFTTKEVGKGTGLGLSIAYGIVKQHNGYINVKSIPGRGTKFSIYLPTVKANEEAGEVVKDSEVPPGGVETILLAEDDPTVGGFHKTLLEAAGYTVIVAVDGEETLRKFAEYERDIDLLILDVIMPKMNGKKAYDVIRKVKPGVKAMFLSGYPADYLNDAEIVRERESFLAKPVDPNDLLRKVREVLSGG